MQKKKNTNEKMNSIPRIVDSAKKFFMQIYSEIDVQDTKLRDWND